MKKKLIGQGAFTKAYLREDGQVLLISRDPIKECMALGFFPDSYMFPQIEIVKRLDEDYAEYLMDYLPRPSSLKQNLDADQWQIYKDLRALYMNGEIVLRNESLERWHNAFNTLKNEELREIMIEALDATANYGSDIGFEISPRNVTAQDGKLILLDCFYQISKLD